MIFEIGERFWKIALCGVKNNSKGKAAKELVRLGENVDNELAARRILKNLPHPIHVKNNNLDEFKEIFDTQEFFHHQKYLGDPLKGIPNKEVWVTLKDPSENPSYYFHLASKLISSDSIWDSVKEAKIILNEDVVLTIGRRP